MQWLWLSGLVMGNVVRLLSTQSSGPSPTLLNLLSCKIPLFTVNESSVASDIFYEMKIFKILYGGRLQNRKIWPSVKSYPRWSDRLRSIVLSTQTVLFWSKIVSNCFLGISTIHYPPSTIPVVFGIFEYHELLGVLWVFTTMVSTNKETIGINDKSTSVITSWLNGNPRVFEIPNKSAFDGLVSSLFRSSSSVGGRPRTSEEKCLIMP